MIQFNLLPDVKLEYLKAQYRQRVAVTTSIVVSVFFLVVLIGLFIFVRIAQPHQMNAVSSDIKKQTAEINKVEDLNRILTVQNQLKSLPALHDNKAISSRLFDYLVQLTPAQATISDVTLDLEANTLSIQGNADALSTVNKFADTLKFTNFKSNGADGKDGKAFSNVVLSSFALTAQSSSGGANKQVSYTLDFAFDPVIFENVKDADGKTTDVKLTVPSIITTRSAVEKPGALFDAQPQPVPAGGEN